MFTPAARGRFLKGTGDTYTPNSVAFVAATGVDPCAPPSAKSQRHQLRCWSLLSFRLRDGHRSQVEHHTGTTALEFAQRLDARQRPRMPLWVMGHDLSYCASLLRFWNLLDEGYFSVGPILPGPNESRVQGEKPWKGYLCLESAPVFASLMGRRGKVQLVDTSNYFHCGLRELAASVGHIPRQQPTPADPDEMHTDYLTWQCVLLADVFTKLWDRWREMGAGPWQKTGAALSLASYKASIGQATAGKRTPALVVARDEACEVIERQALHGGRCEPFFLGPVVGEFYKLDVSSLYPHVMATQLFPSRRLGRLEGVTPAELWRQTRTKLAVADVLIDSPTETYPLKHDGYLCFARGSFWTTLAGAELERAIVSDHVKAVHAAVLYDRRDLFSTWVERWYALKQEAHAKGLFGMAERTLSKLILNSLYGKFAQHGERWVSLPGEPCFGGRWGAWTEVTPSGEHRKCRAIAGVRQERHLSDPPNYYFPAVTACVTAAAREHLRRLIAICPRRSCYYVSTDMLLVDRDGYDALVAAGEVQDNTLGKLTVQGRYSKIDLVAPMWYQLDEEWIRCGSWGRAEQDSDGRWVYQHTSRLPSLLATLPDGTVTVQTSPLKPTDRWAKGRIGDDGWVVPYLLSTFTRAPR